MYFLRVPKEEETNYQTQKIRWFWPGPRASWGPIRTRLAVQCRLHQMSAPQTDSSPISRPSGKVKILGDRELAKLIDQTQT